MPAPPIPTKWIRRIRRMRRTSAFTAAGDLATGHLQADIHHTAGRVWLGQAACGTAHGHESFWVHQYLGQLRGKRVRVSRVLWQEDGGTFLGQIVGIAALVVV